MSEERNKVLVITIDLGEGCRDQITVYQNDEPEELAEDFCCRHNFDDRIKQVLQNQIEYELYKIVNKAKPQQNLDEEGSANEDDIPNEFAVSPEQVIDDKSSIHEQSSKDFFEEIQIVRPNVCSPSKHKTKASRSKKINEINTRLYYNGLAKKASHTQKLNETKLAIEERELLETTFKPQTNQWKGKSSWEQRLNSTMHLKNKHIEELKRAKRKLEASECTFNPKLTKAAKAHAKGNRFEMLYKQAELKKEQLQEKKKKIYETQCPFAPVINSYPVSLENTIKKISEQSIELISDSQLDNYFRPQVGRPPKNRDFSPEHVGEHLYSMAKVPKTPENKKKTKKLTTKKSEQLVNELKYKRYREIFEELCPIDGVIDRNHVDYTTIDGRIKEILEPLFQEMNDKVNFQDFSDSMDILMKMLTCTEKREILMNKKTCLNKSQSTHRERPRRQNEVYYRNVRKKRESEQRKDYSRIQTASFEMEHCTFKPHISPLPRSSRKK